jgi:hypothetical protein
MTTFDPAWSAFYWLTNALKQPQSVYSCARRTQPLLVIQKGIREPEIDETPLSRKEQEFAVRANLLVNSEAQA